MCNLLGLLGALALLVCDAAAGLAGGLAGGLALAAAATLCALAQVAGLDGLDVFHSIHLSCWNLRIQFSTIHFL